MTTVKLADTGIFEGTEAINLKIGDKRLRDNNSHTIVESVRISKSGKTVYTTESFKNSEGIKMFLDYIIKFNSLVVVA